MAELNQVYKCTVCGLSVKVVEPVAGVTPVCCGQPMSVIGKDNSK